MIVVRVHSDADIAAGSLRGTPGVLSVEVHSDELTITVGDGPALVSTVAVALDRADVSVAELTLRRPTLDDVFLELTGGHLADTDDLELEEEYA